MLNSLCARMKLELCILHALQLIQNRTSLLKRARQSLSFGTVILFWLGTGILRDAHRVCDGKVTGQRKRKRNLKNALLLGNFSRSTSEDRHGPASIVACNGYIGTADTVAETAPKRLENRLAGSKAASIMSCRACRGLAVASLFFSEHAFSKGRSALKDPLDAGNLNNIDADTRFSHNAPGYEGTDRHNNSARQPSAAAGRFTLCNMHARCGGVNLKRRPNTK